MSGFDTTRWSLVLQARGDTVEARAALEALCRTYRPAVVAYVRSHGHSADAAEDIAQAFFLRFIDHAWHAGADRERGRFRAYLLTMLKHHLIGVSVEANALKRGGSASIESIDDADDDVVLDDATPERNFEQAWAIALVARALARLRDEADKAGKRTLFEGLREFLVERPDEADYARAAAALGLRRNTLAVAVHRLRHRLRELIEAELMDTTSAATDLEAELHDLRGVLAADAVQASPRGASDANGHD